jgi:hypothetical protein
VVRWVPHAPPGQRVATIWPPQPSLSQSDRVADPISVSGLTKLSPPGRLLDASPFQHSGSAPLHPPTPGPLVVLVGVAVVLTGIGAAGLRRRDLG